MTIIIMICALIMLALDYFTLRRITSTQQQMCIWMTILAIIDSLPFIGSDLLYLLSFDNPTLFSQIGLWRFFAFMILAIARQPINIALLLHRRWTMIAGVAITLSGIFVIFHGMLVTRTNYIVNRVEITSNRLPSSFNGYRVVQISDFHIGTMLNAEKELNAVAEICNSLNPDIITFCGDLTNIRHNEVTPSIELVLRKFQAHDGIYSVLGNHDIGIYVRDSIRLTPETNTRCVLLKQQQIGWRTLNDETCYILREKDSISITGLSFKQAQHETRHSSEVDGADFESAYSATPKHLFNITLTHLPQLWDKILTTHPADLTLAGHVHAMQISATIGKFRLSPARILYERWSGLYSEDDKHLYINDGIGYGLYPLRIGARPEITLFELKSTSHNTLKMGNLPHTEIQ